MGSWLTPKITYNGTSFIPVYPPKAKIPIDGQRASRHDSITTSGVQQSINERIDRVNTFDFPNIPESELPGWDAFLSWALAGNQWQYTPDSSTSAIVFTAAANASAGSTVYTGTVPGGVSGGQVGKMIAIAGFVTTANNGNFMCTASDATHVTVDNAAGVAETHAATGSVGFFYYLTNMDGIPKWVAFQTYQLILNARRVLRKQIGS